MRGMSMSEPKRQRRELINPLPPTQLLTVVGLLEAILDPLSLSISHMEE
jgi:hypothetical protein